MWEWRLWRINSPSEPNNCHKNWGLRNVELFSFGNFQCTAPLAQWIEHWTSDPGVMGSTPIWCTFCFPLCVSFCHFSLGLVPFAILNPSRLEIHVILGNRLVDCVNFIYLWFFKTLCCCPVRAQKLSTVLPLKSMGDSSWMQTVTRHKWGWQNRWYRGACTWDEW